MASPLDENENSSLMTGINITPFVDVALVLLVIFIVTAPMLVKDVLEIKLPKSKQGDGQVTETLGIAVNRNGNILLNGEIADEEQLKAKAREVLAMNSESQAIIAADVEVAYGKVVRVIELLKEVGLNKFAVQIEKQKSASGPDTSGTNNQNPPIQETQ